MTIRRSGLCEGGPLNGLIAASRFPKGFLLVNRAAGEVAIYEWDPQACIFAVRRDELDRWQLPELTDDTADKNRYRAAIEPNYDVIAYDSEEMLAWG